MNNLGKFLFLMLFILPIFELQAANLSLTEQDIKQAIEKEFAEQGFDDEVEVEIYGGNTSFVIENAKQGKVMVSQLDYDETQNKFTAKAEIFADGKSVSSTFLQGKYYILQEVYVPAHNINKGEIIKQEDLKALKIRNSRIKPLNVTEMDNLVGKESKRPLKKGKLITQKEIGEKILVHKNDKVSLIYKTDKMQITAKGIAKEDGSKGQRIETENSKSGKKVYGIVTDAYTVEVEIQ